MRGCIHFARRLSLRDLPQPPQVMQWYPADKRPRWVGAFGPEMTSNLWYASGVALGATTMFQSCMESLTELWLACGTEEGK